MAAGVSCTAVMGSVPLPLCAQKYAFALTLNPLVRRERLTSGGVFVQTLIGNPLPA